MPAELKGASAPVGPERAFALVEPDRVSAPVEPDQAALDVLRHCRYCVCSAGSGPCSGEELRLKAYAEEHGMLVTMEVLEERLHALAEEQGRR